MFVSRSLSKRSTLIVFPAPEKTTHKIKTAGWPPLPHPHPTPGPTLVNKILNDQRITHAFNTKHKKQGAIEMDGLDLYKFWAINSECPQ